MRQELVSFDTHEQFKNFQKAGFEESQAEVIIRAINSSREYDLSKLATKDQVIALEKDIKSLEKDIKNLEKDIKNLEEKLKIEIKAEVKEATNINIKWMVSLMLPLYIAVFGFILKSFIH